MNLDAQVEAILFFKGESVRLDELARLLSKSKEEVAQAIASLKGKLESRGITLVEGDGEVMMRTSPEASALIEKIEKEELVRDLGKAGSETLSVILYKGPISRAEIEYIRGVNSTFILRNLLIRGLIERVQNPKDQRGFLYKPTIELLSFLGIPSIDKLPQYETVRKELDAFAESQEAKEAANESR